MRQVLRTAPAWGAGLLWGAFVPAAIVAAGMQTPYVLPFVLGITIVHAFGLGLPVALVFRWQGWTRLLAAVAAGVVIGLIPIAILAWPPDLRETGSSLLVAGAFGALGAVGAATFWLVLRLCDALTPNGPQSPRLGAILAVLGASADVGCFVFL